MAEDHEESVAERLGELLPRLWRFALVLCRDRSVAEDLVQATCLRAIERARQFDPATRLDRWTFAILASIWKNELRRRGTFERFAGAWALDLRPAADENPERAALARQVLALVERLPEAQRAIALLVYAEDYTYREAADTLGIPLGTAMSRLHAARLSLARLVQERPAQDARAAGPPPRRGPGMPG